MYRRILLIFLISFSVGTISAQQPLSTANIITSTTNTGTGIFYPATSPKYQAPRAIAFEGPTLTSADFLANIKGYFNIGTKFSFEESESNTDNLGMHHHLMQQYYKGIPMEGLAYRVHEKNGFVTSANGKAMRDINLDDISTTISEEQAFNLAVEYLQTKDTIFRSGKKLIVSKNFTFAPESFSVAFQFDIDVSLIERWRISIDARSGEIINKVSLVQSCLEPLPLPYTTGLGLTNYYGIRSIRVETVGSGSRLKGQTEHGGKIETYDFENRDPIWLIIPPIYFTPKIFSSGDNIYDSYYEKPAASVQWATEQAYEYYYNRHNRNSFDNNGATIKCYVHVGEGYNNAMWTRGVLAFGDGSNNNPLVELDVVSHELTHAVTENEADLNYYYEPGALNESFSDIMGKAVDFNKFGNTATWQIARHHESGGIRDMSNPNLKDQPDTYQGDMWYMGSEDSGGVHYNSGVQNFWFYLLCEGGNGVNDNGDSYSVESIGMDTAVNISYRNLTEYLISSSDYFDSRIGSLLATADLYGKNSSAYQEVDKAWDAVGVIDEPIITSLNLYDITATTVKLNGSFLPRGDTVTYHFEYGTTPEFDSSTSLYEYTGTVEGIITGLQSKTKYYVRLVATNENGESSTASEFTTLPLTPLVEIKNTVDVTETNATLYGKINPNSLATSFYFEYGPTPDMGLVSSAYSLPDTTEFLNVSAPVTDLQPRQTYYYKLIATNNFAIAGTDSLNFFTAVKPVISSFTPVTATIATEVTITGQHFNPNPEMNWVNFGATRAEVVSVSATEIKVKVPAGASFGPISLLDIESGLATRSAQEFVPTYTGDFGKGSLTLRAAFDDINVYEMAVQDMDGDSRPDIVISHNQGVTILQNVNTGGEITNESFIRSNVPVTSFSFESLVDFDGNGLKDIVGKYEDGLRVYPNFSVPGYNFFQVPVDLSIGFWSYLEYQDFDNDGYIDIAALSWKGTEGILLTIFRNQSPKETLSQNSFEQRYSKLLPYDFVRSLSSEDLNNDGTPDMLLSTDGNYFLILTNKSYPGVFEFEERIVMDSIGGRYGKYVAHDLNQDGWKDITSFSSIREGKVAVHQNMGPGTSLLQPIVALDGYTERSMQPGDITGNGKVDLLVGDFDGRFILLKNKTENSDYLSDSSFELFEHYGINDNSHTVESEVILNDLNGDGRPEVINNLGYGFYPFKGHQLEIWQNAPGDCPDPSLIDLAVSRNSATLILPSNTTLEDFEIEYATAGYTNWRQTSVTTLNYLSSGVSYQLRARAKCYLGYTGYSYIDFTTECINLSDFTVSNIQVNNITLNAYNLSSTEVQYSGADKDQWEAVSQYTDQISGLLPGTTYDLRYRGRCDTPAPFNYTQFTTLCPILSTLYVDDLTYNKAEVNWTSKYPGDAILEYSTDNINWTLIDETQTLFPLFPGTEYFIRGQLACTDTGSDFIYTSFTTRCPTVSMLTVDAITPISANMNWVDESGTGSYTITYETASNEIKTIETNSTSFYLEGLTPGTQYTVSFAPECISPQDFTSTTFTTVCYTPFNLSVDAITHTTVQLSWDDNYSSLPYTIDYAILGSNAWLTTESASTTATLEALRPGTRYEARVHINCSSVKAQFVAVIFEISLYGETMIAPNPTENTMTIYPSKNLIGNSFGIYDNTGRRVAGGKLLDYTFDLSGFPAGIYMLRIEGEKVFRVVKE